MTASVIEAPVLTTTLPETPEDVRVFVAQEDHDREAYEARRAAAIAAISARQSPVSSRPTMRPQETTTADWSMTFDRIDTDALPGWSRPETPKPQMPRITVINTATSLNRPTVAAATPEGTEPSLASQFITARPEPLSRRLRRNLFEGFRALSQRFFDAQPEVVSTEAVTEPITDTESTTSAPASAAQAAVSPTPSLQPLPSFLPKPKTPEEVAGLHKQRPPAFATAQPRPRPAVILPPTLGLESTPKPAPRVVLDHLPPVLPPPEYVEPTASKPTPTLGEHLSAVFDEWLDGRYDKLLVKRVGALVLGVSLALAGESALLNHIGHAGKQQGRVAAGRTLVQHPSDSHDQLTKRQVPVQATSHSFTPRVHISAGDGEIRLMQNLSNTIRAHEGKPATAINGAQILQTLHAQGITKITNAPTYRMADGQEGLAQPNIEATFPQNVVIAVEQLNK